MYKISVTVLGGLMLAGCAGMDGKSGLFMDASISRPPPLPVADMAPPKTHLKPNIKIKREASPPPLPQPKPVEPPPPPPPHHWYDHLKFWK